MGVKYNGKGFTANVLSFTYASGLNIFSNIQISYLTVLCKISICIYKIYFLTSELETQHSTENSRGILQQTGAGNGCGETYTKLASNSFARSTQLYCTDAITRNFGAGCSLCWSPKVIVQMTLNDLIWKQTIYKPMLANLLNYLINNCFILFDLHNASKWTKFVSSKILPN